MIRPMRSYCPVSLCERITTVMKVHTFVSSDICSHAILSVRVN